MHIIVLENQPSSKRGGQELVLFDVCRGLSQCGHSITLLYLEEGNLLEQYQEFCTDTIKINSFLLDRSTLSSSFMFFKDIWKVPVGRDSVIYSNRYHDVVFGSLLSLLRNVPLVCYLQLPPHQSKFGRPHTLGLKGVRKFIAISNQTKLDWVDVGLKKEKIDIVYVGINLKIYKPAPAEDFSAFRKKYDIPENVRVVSYIGRLDREKGLEKLIGAFALLVKKGIDARLLIAGRPVAHESLEAGEQYKRSLEQLSIDLGVKKHVSFLGHVSNTTSVYQASDITVLPSVWSEPFGRVIIESMACGTPVIASRTGGIPEILTGEFQNALVEPGSEDALFQAFNQLIDWRDADPLLGNRCRMHIISKFNLDKMVNGIEQVLLNVSQNSTSYNSQIFNESEDTKSNQAKVL